MNVAVHEDLINLVTLQIKDTDNLETDYVEHIQDSQYAQNILYCFPAL